MTTKVIIQSPENNHKNVLITPQNGRGDYMGPPKILTDGESAEFYVHDHQHLLIMEVDKQQS